MTAKAKERKGPPLEKRKRSDIMIYELRTYECVPGKLPALNDRFANITLKLWEKHSIRQAGFWTTLIGQSNQIIFWSGRALLSVKRSGTRL